MASTEHRQLALELTKLTIQSGQTSHAAWGQYRDDPDKWRAFVQKVYKECIATISTEED
jgi:hypothetical protein